MLITFHEMLREDNDDNKNEDKVEKDEASTAMHAPTPTHPPTYTCHTIDINTP